MTFNLRVDNQADGQNVWRHRVDAVVALIQSHQPALIGTQEGLAEMLRTMQDGLPDYEVIGEGRGGGESDEYSAIFYQPDQLMLCEQGQFWLSETPTVPGSMSWQTACPRICTWGRFSDRLSPEKEVVVFNTHLDHVSQDARMRGVELIIASMQPHLAHGRPVILTGDLNVTPDNAVIALLEAAGLKRVVTHGRTFHDFKGGSSGAPIDYIFTSQPIHVAASDVDRSSEHRLYPSDHYPVIAEVTI